MTVRRTLTVTIQNPRLTRIVITGFTVTGEGFSVSEYPETPLTLQSKGSVDLAVYHDYDNTLTGSYTGTLTVSVAGDDPLEIPLVSNVITMEAQDEIIFAGLTMTWVNSQLGAHKYRAGTRVVYQITDAAVWNASKHGDVVTDGDFVYDKYSDLSVIQDEMLVLTDFKYHRYVLVNNYITDETSTTPKDDVSIDGENFSWVESRLGADRYVSDNDEYLHLVHITDAGIYNLTHLHGTPNTTIYGQWFLEMEDDNGPTYETVLDTRVHPGSPYITAISQPWFTGISSAGSTETLDVTSEDSWLIYSCPTWITPNIAVHSTSPTVKRITLSIAASTQSTVRSGELVLIDSRGAIYTVPIDQNAANVTLSTDVTTIAITPDDYVGPYQGQDNTWLSKTLTINVTANGPWTASIGSNTPWLQFVGTPSGTGDGSFQIYVIMNMSQFSSAGTASSFIRVISGQTSVGVTVALTGYPTEAYLLTVTPDRIEIDASQMQLGVDQVYHSQPSFLIVGSTRYWNVRANVPWIIFDNDAGLKYGDPGRTQFSFTTTADPMSYAEQRTGTMTLTDNATELTITVVQSGNLPIN